MSRPIGYITFGADLDRLELARAIGAMIFAVRNQGLDLERQEGQRYVYTILRKEDTLEN